jgi:hypothetical protein
LIRIVTEAATKRQQKTTFLKSKIIEDTGLRRFQEKISRGVEVATKRQRVACSLPLCCRSHVCVGVLGAFFAVLGMKLRVRHHP